MEKKEMMDTIAEAMDMGMKKHRMGNDMAGIDMEGMKKSFMDSISPRPRRHERNEGNPGQGFGRC